MAGQTFTLVLPPDSEDGGFMSQCREIPEAVAEGATEHEALDTLTEVLAAHLDQGQEPKAGKGRADELYRQRPGKGASQVGGQPS